MLHEFDAWLEAKYLSEKARKDRWAWNFGIQQGRPITVRENRQWKPAVAYCRYADDFVVIVKGTKAHAEAICEFSLNPGIAVFQSACSLNPGRAVSISLMIPISG